MVKRLWSSVLSAVLAGALVCAQAAPAATASESCPARLPGGDAKAASAGAAKTGVGVAARTGLLPATEGIPGAVALPPSPVAGSLDHATHKQDVYAVPIWSEKRFAAVLTGQAALDADVYIFRPGTTVADPSAALCSTLGDEFPKSVVLDVPDGAFGVYYVVVYAWSGSGSYSLEWQMIDRAVEPDDDIPGTPLTASASMQSTAGALAWPSDLDDVYAIPVQDGQRLIVELDGPSGADFDLRLFGPGTPTIVGASARFGSSGPSADESLVHDVLAGEGGTWYVDVRAARGAGTYTLRWRVVAVPTGTWETLASATPIFGASGTIIGSLDRLSDANDVFALGLAAGKRLTVTLDGEQGTDFDLYLHSPDGSRVVAFDEDSTYPDRLQADISQAGTYYIEVRVFRGAGGYVLGWSVSDTPAFTACARDFGVDRYATAIAVSQATFAPSSVTTVVVASGEDFPDALSAAGLAGCYGSPVLLTRRTSLPSGLDAEIARLGARGVAIIGGTGAVSSDVEDALRAKGYATERIAGLNRYATARKVAEKIRALAGGRFSGIAFVARGDDFADALAVGPCAYALRAPVLLTTTTSLHPDAQGAIVDCRISDVYIAGGVGAVSESVRQAIQPLVARPVIRLAGADRYATGVAVAEYATKLYWLEEDGVVVATGTLFPDALGGGAAAGKRGFAVLLTRPTSLPDATAGYLAARRGTIMQARIAGGTGAVSEQVRTAIEGLLR